MPQSLLEVSGLTRSFGQRMAVDHLSFTVAQGEIFGLLGPNGSGKTTLFRMLSTLIDPDEGTVTLDGLSLGADRNAIRHRIGVVFQSPSLDKKLTLTENLLHQGHLYGMKGEVLKKRIEQLLGRFQIADRSGEIVEKLSGGLQRRLEIAKGLLHSPSVLFLDEPSTGLDPGARRELWSYLHEINDQEKVTILVTTHLMDEAERCHRLLILDHGKNVALDSPTELKKKVTGTVITAVARDPHQLLEEIRLRFSAAAVVTEEGLRLEWNHNNGTRSAAEWVGQIMESFGKSIDSITLAQPNLEDVFIHLTGHEFFVETATED